MKKLKLLLLLPLLLSSGCNQSDKLPYNVGDSSIEFHRFLNENIDYGMVDNVYFFKYGNRGYLVADAPFTATITKIESYPTTLPSVYDFYRLTPFMDIFDVAKIVGVPDGFNSSGVIWVAYPTKEGNLVSVYLMYNDKQVYYGNSFIVDPIIEN